MLNYIVIFLVAILTSTASALVGLGGGLLLIPFIVLIFNLPLKYVAGTMLLAMVPYTIIATSRNLKSGYVNFRIGLTMEIGSIMGVLTGANVTTLIPDLVLRIIFVLVVLYLMFTLRIPTDSPYNYVAKGFRKLSFIPPHLYCKTAQDSRCSIPALIFIGFIAGFFSGMLGIGGGFLKTPVLIVGVMLPPKVAVGTALFMISITAAFGAAEHALLGHIYIHLAIAITAGMMIGAFLGTTIFKKLPDLRIKKFIFLAMLVAGILTLFR